MVRRAASSVGVPAVSVPEPVFLRVGPASPGTQNRLLQRPGISHRIPGGSAAGVHLFSILKKLLRLIIRPRSVFAILLAIGTLEFCARLDNYISYGTPFFGADSIDNLFTTDRLGKRGKPNAR